MIISFDENSSPARKIGLREDDIVIEFAGKTVSGIDELHKLLTEEEIGKPQMIMVLRGTKRLEFEIVPLER